MAKNADFVIVEIPDCAYPNAYQPCAYPNAYQPCAYPNAYQPCAVPKWQTATNISKFNKKYYSHYKPKPLETIKPLESNINPETTITIEANITPESNIKCQTKISIDESNNESIDESNDSKKKVSYFSILNNYIGITITNNENKESV